MSRGPSRRCGTLIFAVALIICGLFLVIVVDNNNRISDSFSSVQQYEDTELIFINPNVRENESFMLKDNKCPCTRHRKYEFDQSKPQTSSCSDEATEYGPGTKVISFSMYATDPASIYRYLSGLEPNLEAIPKVYPNWKVRVYTNISRDNEHSCKYICKYEHLFWCDIRNIPKYGDLSNMNPRAWRFIALGDPNVDVFISRDLDSVVGERERLAVRQWEESNYTIHSMRDHPEHSNELLGGMWGVKQSLGAETTYAMQKQLVETGVLDQSRGWDETIIAQTVYWPQKHNILSHDSYYCTKHPEGLTLPYPTRRVGNEFVGQVTIRTNYTAQPCPESCRPSHGKHWSTC